MVCHVCKWSVSQRLQLMIIVNVLSVNKTKDNNSKQDKYDNLVTGRRKKGKTTLCY